MTSPTKEQWLVLFDHLATVFPSSDASEFLLWMRNPDAVRTLVQRDLDAEDDFGTTCGYCDTDYVHDKGCEWMNALRALQDPRADLDFEAARNWAEAHESTLRSNAKRKATRAATMARKKLEKLAGITHRDPRD